ncbi:hypothetical protein ACVW1B_002607 [Bradyrhizobium sp. USDA 4502]
MMLRRWKSDQAEAPTQLIASRSIKTRRSQPIARATVELAIGLAVL